MAWWLPAGRPPSMASITIRQLDESLKQQLRLRAASHGRSMEDEVRTILRAAATGPAEVAPARSQLRRAEPPTADSAGPSPVPKLAASTAMRRVLLIIGGGIAAYKSLDLI